jgi:putative transposase
MYPAAIIDVYSRYIVLGRSNTMTSEWSRECLETGINRYGAPEIINTDQGSQFTSLVFTEFIASYEGLQLSMDDKGRAIDNIFIERF